MLVLEQEIKELIVSALGLEGVTAEQIDSEAALFGEGLGLDSIDALELGIAISKRYDVTLDPNSEDLQSYFASVRNLARFVEKQRSSGATVASGAVVSTNVLSTTAE